MRKILFLCLILLLQGCSLFSHEKPWFVPKPLPTIAKPMQIELLWQQSLGLDSHQLALTPSYAQGTLFVSGGKHVVAVDTKQGKTLWRQAIKHEISTGVTIADDQILVASVDGWLVALDRKDGHIIWEQELGSQILAKPTYVNKHIYVKTMHGDVRALTSAGKTIWQYHHDEPVLVLRRSSEIKPWHDKLLVGFADSFLIMLDQDSGKVVWEQAVSEKHGSSDVEKMIDIDADPVIIEDTALTLNYQGNLTYLGLTRGSLFWQKAMSSYLNFLYYQDLIYLVDDTSRIMAIALSSNDTKWSSDAYQYRVLTAPAQLGKYLLLGDAQGYVHVVNRLNGKPQAYRQLSKKAFIAEPVVVGKTAYVLDAGGQLFAISL